VGRFPSEIPFERRLIDGGAYETCAVAEKYPVVADIEYDYGGATDPWNEVKKCFAYCKSALE
jgi:hypothetical protein